MPKLGGRQSRAGHSIPVPILRIEITEEPASALVEYATVPIAFRVQQVLDLSVLANGLGGLLLSERTLETPYLKDYDVLPGAHPREWAQQFDLSEWVFFAARMNGRRVGGATVASGSAGLQILEGRPDLAVLWDIRVSPEARGRGAGSMLFQAAERCAAGRGCRQLKVETQNINVPACKFYLQHGCALGAVHRFAYPQCPEEIQLLWYKDLPNSPAA